MNLIEKVTNSQIRKDMPDFRVGDTVRVDLKIKEVDSKGNEKTRIQAFEGLVMAIKGSGVSKTFTVRKVSGNVGSEKTLPVNSPVIDSVTIVRKKLLSLDLIEDTLETRKFEGKKPAKLYKFKSTIKNKNVF